MSNRMWENTVEHAKTCVLGGKLYVYYIDETHSKGAVFNHIYELRGLIADGQFFPLESLTHSQKVGCYGFVIQVLFICLSFKLSSLRFHAGFSGFFDEESI